MADLKIKKEILEELIKNNISQLNLKYEKKDIEKSIKDEYASIHQLKNKKGENDLAQVKMSEIDSAASLFFGLTKQDNLKEKYERREEYLKNMKKGEREFPINSLKKYLNIKELNTSLKGESKDIQKKCVEKEIEEEEIKGLVQIAKLIKDKKEEDLKEEIAKKENKSYKRKDGNIDMVVRKLLKELNINI